MRHTQKFVGFAWPCNFYRAWPGGSETLLRVARALTCFPGPNVDCCIALWDWQLELLDGRPLVSEVGL